MQREAFIGKMRERAQQRLKAFVSKTGLNESQTAAFESTVSALDATLRETARGGCARTPAGQAMKRKLSASVPAAGAEEYN